jgi:uncharacterized membrane protein YphA (DoxX/SURF4 family)
MNFQDLFVGGVSTIVGSLGVAAGLGNWDKCYEFSKSQWLVKRIGRTGARLVYIIGGSFFIILGIAIACGFAVNKHLSANRIPTPLAQPAES